MQCRALSLLLLSVLPLARCSFIGLDTFDLPRCTSNRDCDELNAERNVPSGACQRYQCVQPERQCRLTARDQDGDGDAPVMCGGTDCDDTNDRRNGARAPRPLAETCDGLDNNCNDVVDEGVWLGAPVTVGTVPAPVATASASSRDDGRTGICTTTNAGVPSFSVLQGQRLETGAIRYEARIPGDGRTQQVTDRCPVLTRTGTFGLGTCNAVEAVAAPLDAGRWFVATLNTSGCAQGQVRIGWMAESDRHLVLDVVGSPIAAGIDVTPAESCTGASRVSPVRGAASLAITSIPAQGATPAHALVTWLAVDRAANVCGETKVIEGIVVTVAPHRVAGGGMVDAVVSVGDSRPMEIGRTRGGGPVGVTSLPEEGRFEVGFGNDEGRASLRSVLAATAPPSLGPIQVIESTMAEARELMTVATLDRARLAIAVVSNCSDRVVSLAEVTRINQRWTSPTVLAQSDLTTDGTFSISPARNGWVLSVLQTTTGVGRFVRGTNNESSNEIRATDVAETNVAALEGGIVLLARSTGQVRTRACACVTSP
jgi:hypothetical protein